MSFDKPYHNYGKLGNNNSMIPQNTRSIYYGEVISIEDEYDSGRIKVRIPDIDKTIGNDDLIYCYPLLPKFFHLIPKVGEVVRIFIEDVRMPQRSRFWLGSVISQPQKFEFDLNFSALSTTNIGLTKPEKSPSSIPDAKGIYPDKEDIGIIGRLNTDILLKPNQVIMRAGKHDPDNKLKLNIKNSASLSLNFDANTKNKNVNYYSNGIIIADKIAFVSHTGNPRVKTHSLTIEDRQNIFDSCHPIPRGDILVEILKMFKKALSTHVHAYSGVVPDILALAEIEKIDFDVLLQKNIVIN